MALLGLLYETPGHGYDLHRRVNTDLGQVWHLSQSQAYAILKRLEARGDISAEAVPQEKLPPRQLLMMTDQGRQRFLDWLGATSGGSTRAIRLEFVTRLYFLQMYMPEKIPDTFERQSREAADYLHRLEKTFAELSEDQIYNRMSIMLRLKQMHLILAWLQDCQTLFSTSSG
jgi:DNA-binding PadR family transcriptional regulator